MCIIFFIASDDSSSPYKLILASNRDEIYQRPTKGAHPWTNAEHVIAGKDLENGREGGTWLGVSGKDSVIKVGALLNLPGECEKKLIENSAGRGPIVANYLTGCSSNFDYSDSILRSKVPLNAFNFVSVEFNELQKSCQILHTSNSPREIQEFPNDTVHGFSNSGWRTPLQKVAHGKRLFTKIIQEQQHSEEKDQLVSNLMTLLSEDTQFPDDQELKRRVGHDKRWPQFSSIYVTRPDIAYGSRTKTVILIDNHGKMDFYEESITSDGTWTRAHLERQML